MPDAPGIAPAVWLVDKPAGPTSHDVVARVRRAVGRTAKVGHAGTLDPFATGLLVVLVGRATRLAPYLSGLDKTYLARVRTGFTSATLDPEGPVEPSGPPATIEGIRAVLPGFVGRQPQRVPALSAVHVDGERLYARARRGEAPPEGALPEREVVIHSAEVVEDHGGGEATIEVRCGAGTYLRRLAGDIGERLGAGAYCAALRRTRVGALSVDDAVPPEAVGPAGGLAPVDGLAHLPTRVLRDDEAERVLHGRPVPAEGHTGAAVALVARGRLVAVGAVREGAIAPAVVLEDPR